MGGSSPTHIILRQLTASELGWFEGPRHKGEARGHQYGINFNRTSVDILLTPEQQASKAIRFRSKRPSESKWIERPLRKQGKNWRLVGPMVSGPGLGSVRVGDLFWGRATIEGRPPFELTWDVISRASEPELHQEILRRYAGPLSKGRQMVTYREEEPSARSLGALISDDRKGSDSEAVPGPGPTASPPGEPDVGASSTSDSKMREQVEAGPGSRGKRVGAKLKVPNIMTELVKSGLALSAKAQADFIDVLDRLSDSLRELFRQSNLIRKVEVDHASVWANFRGVRLGFVDGGVANIAALGAAPVAIRVGSYTVAPGVKGPDRESFDFQVQLVDDLYEPSTGGSGVYEDVFEDVAKLRDAARIACEIAGVLKLSQSKERPAIVFLHGPLVNPVSPYGLGTPGQPGAFPDFTSETLSSLLPTDGKQRAGRAANFIQVYLDILNALRGGECTACGVVERPSSSAPGPLMLLHLQGFQASGLMDAASYHEFRDKMEKYRITDSIIFECILDEGEYIVPAELDKQAPDWKIPKEWDAEIRSYPKPLTTYLKSHVETMPVRVEYFPSGPLGKDSHRLMALVVHMSRLLPRYSFPVGLDIVDRHAKVPEWMSKQVSTMLTAQLMRKVMESGNADLIRMVRRVLSSNKRDWLFRPDFRGGQ